MAIGNPFSTTYEGSRQAGMSLGAGIQQAASAIGSKVEQVNQGQATQNLLKQLGILKPKEASFEDWQKFGKENKIDIPSLGTETRDASGNVIGKTSPISKDEATNLIKTMADKLGLQHPKSQEYELDWDKLVEVGAKTGLKYKPDMFGGTTEFAPPKPESAEDVEYKQARADYYKAQTEQKKGNTLSPSMKRLKKLDTDKLIGVTSRNNLTIERTKEVLSDLESIPMGKLGQMNIGAMRLMGSKDPIMAKWQNLKSLLSKITLGQLQFTKGAISDAEMKFFKTAAADDDVQSMPAIKDVLERAMQDSELENASLSVAYEKNYGEDPNEILSKVTKPGSQPVAEAAGTAPKSGGFKAGDIREKDGKKYQRNEDGQWLPL